MSGTARGRLVALEGVDGSGKSTQAHRLAAALGALATHEPGATGLGRTLRRVVLDGAHEGEPPVARAEALLMAADRAQHVEEVLRPALAAGRWVVTDRYSGSTIAYQGYGRGLDPAGLRAVVEWAAGGLAPDLTVVLDVPLALARARLAGADRLERLDAAFFERVREGYLQLAAADPAGWVVLDGAAGPDEVAARVATVVRDRLGSPGDPGSAGAP